MFFFLLGFFLEVLNQILIMQKTPSYGKIQPSPLETFAWLETVALQISWVALFITFQPHPVEYTQIIQSCYELTALS